MIGSDEKLVRLLHLYKGSFVRRSRPQWKIDTALLLVVGMLVVMILMH